MLDWFANLYFGIWKLDLFLWPLAACLVYALFRLTYDLLRCRR